MKNLSFAMKVAIPLAILATQTHTIQANDDVIITDNGLELTVTANRKPQAQNKTLASVTIITRSDIEDANSQDLLGLLRNQRGVTLARTGGIGSLTSVFMRGTESDHVLVLMDGIRIGSDTANFDFSQIPLDQIERIEIVRGPRAALYGSDAIGGVIEITTRKGSRSYVTLQGGSFGAKKISAGFNKKTEKSQFSLNVSDEKYKGFSATNSKLSDYNPDDDGVKKTAINLSASHQLAESIDVGLSLFKGKNKIEYDEGNGAGENESDLEAFSSYLKADVSDIWSNKLTFYKISNELHSSSEYSKFSVDRREINWQNNFVINNTLSMILGINYRDDKGTVGASYTGINTPPSPSTTVESINNKAMYLSANKELGALNLDVAFRRDFHSRAGNKTTGQIAVGYELSNSTNVYASYGTGFRAPGMSDLYYPVFGNPDLKPEKSKSYEVGLKSQISPNSYMELSTFQNKITDLISSGANINKATTKGVELAYNRSFGKLDLGLDFTFLRTDDGNGARLLRRPDRKIGLNLAYKVNENTKLGMNAVSVDTRSDKDFATWPATDVTLNPYHLLNMSVTHKLSKRIKVGLSVENLTNEDYELAYGYNTPKRSAYLSLSYQ